MTSAKMEQLVRDIYADSRVSPQEIVSLRNATDEAATNLLEMEGREGLLDALCKSFDLTNQMVQEAMIRFSKGDYTQLGRAMVLSLIQAHIALLQATVDAFK